MLNVIINKYTNLSLIFFSGHLEIQEFLQTEIVKSAKCKLHKMTTCQTGTFCLQTETLIMFNVNINKYATNLSLLLLFFRTIGNSGIPTDRNCQVRKMQVAEDYQMPNRYILFTNLSFIMFNVNINKYTTNLSLLLFFSTLGNSGIPTDRNCQARKMPFAQDYQMPNRSILFTNLLLITFNVNITLDIQTCHCNVFQDT